MAAPDASRSSADSVDSYIGSLISLTSKSEIRYEGVLLTINTEESSIGLRHVRSFGTEGRKKDGSQVPPGDKVYDYIVFRGTDIKDLQVKSSLPAQPVVPMPHDPAIIQSRYPLFSTTPTALPQAGVGSLPETVYQNPQQQGPSGPTLQGNLPSAQAGAPLGPWAALPHSAINPNGLQMPFYWQRLYGTGELQAPQQSLIQQPPTELQLPSLMNQTFQLSNVTSNFSTSQLPDYPTHLLPLSNGGFLQSSNGLSSFTSSQPSTNLAPPFSEVALNLQSAVGSAESSSNASNAFMNSMIDKTSQIPTANMPLTAGFAYVSPSTSVFDMTSTSPPANEYPKTTLPSLVTPGQLLQPVVSAGQLSQGPETVQKDVQVVQVSSLETLPLSTAPSAVPDTLANRTPAVQQPLPEMREPILPLPSGSGYKLNESPANRHYGFGAGLGRGRGYERHQATKFSEEFDFTAMNEKFKKDEVWGTLGKAHSADEDVRGIQDEENASKPVYVKDDFFDTLSCDALDGGWRNGRTRYSEQFKKDTETFGDFSRHRGGRGWRGQYRGGRMRGGWYNGRGGYGYPNRGRGGYGPPR